MIRYRSKDCFLRKDDVVMQIGRDQFDAISFIKNSRLYKSTNFNLLLSYTYRRGVVVCHAWILESTIEIIYFDKVHTRRSINYLILMSNLKTV